MEYGLPLPPFRISVDSNRSAAAQLSALLFLMGHQHSYAGVPQVNPALMLSSGDGIFKSSCEP